ncbi:phosphoenolpyruvate carboxykinase (ATP) [Sporolactobacillus spathodeae]|uniref:Phosphoenolpyruvate carboxykinase (ATP) n=1 Tax=Sporolactobacillus spathodeae TaxID=1465502 RepID=A0ABS2Q968_9BACL|nr:phosphoenolpyruvate carboxykinase (ATP) [Sporolactobacillus spathodeae]MBM7658315.1 phosphoenolpyruvate carboxykinase (ATP) [Sporolactobacillus spathodeae]
MNATVPNTSILELFNTKDTFINLSVPELIQKALEKNEGVLTDKGALAVTTGKYTGRSPRDKFFVKDKLTADTIDWTRNQPINETVFMNLYQKMVRYLSRTDRRFVFKGFAGADPKHRLAIQVINEYAWQNLFCNQLFIVPNACELKTHQADFTVLSAPGFKADPVIDRTRSEAFIIISFTHRTVLIGGTEYGGEIKKSIFTIMNFLLPQENIMPMHCSANQDASGRVALFFGLSGTGKTTLSNAPGRELIGDDEHGWSNDGVFNVEGGCYAKTIRLSKEKEPQIYNSIQFGTILENVIVHYDDRKPDFDNGALTENTRAAYSLDNVPNAIIPSIGGQPDSIIFLTADAFGVLPPISILTPEQAMYQFLSGYTSKLAGTERGVTDPEATFSTCFGSPFMPRPAAVYAELLGRRIKKHNVRAYLVNTGWTGGPYGVGKRMELGYTRRMIDAALSGELAEAETITDPIFGLHIPKTCAGIPESVLLPWESWNDKESYSKQAKDLVTQFRSNFKNFPEASDEIRAAGPISC